MTRKTVLRSALLGLLAVAAAGCADPRLDELQQFIDSSRAAAPGKTLDPLPAVEPYKPFLYAAQGLKDPFATAEFAKPKAPVPSADGISPDPDRPREELEAYALGSLKFVGTVDLDGLWALIKAPDGVVHRVREGNYLGLDHGQIVALADDRIDLKEIVPNAEGGWSDREAFLSLAE